MLSTMEKRYLYRGFKDTLMSMGVPIKYIPLTGTIQQKNGKVSLAWDENNSVDTWGSLSYNTRQDYSIGKPTNTQTENKVSFLISDFETFSINPRPKDALDITIRGQVKRFVIIGDGVGADFPELFYVADIDSVEHINP